MSAVLRSDSAKCPCSGWDMFSSIWIQPNTASRGIFRCHTLDCRVHSLKSSCNGCCCSKLYKAMHHALFLCLDGWIQSLLTHTCGADSVASVPARSADIYANTALRPDRVWPSVTPDNPFTQVIFWQKAPYARLRKNGWMRLYGMQSGRNGKVELIMEARGGNQYKLEVPLKQVQSACHRCLMSDCCP